MGVGINGGAPGPLFHFGVREKGAGEAGGGRKPAGSPIQCSVVGIPWLPTRVQTAVLIATLIPEPRALPPSLCAGCVGVRGGGAGLRDAARVGGRQVVHLPRNLPGSPASTPVNISGAKSLMPSGIFQRSLLYPPPPLGNPLLPLTLLFPC